ncbi:hypothetical protein V8J38_02790 [Brevundimonas olei]|uniref:Uncharacterized protein n=1 Tax=Brevundimonas olei TaxID=657642 RepID=A0ABZ2ICP8_9CAUL
MLSTTLAACAHRAAEAPPQAEPVVVVRTVKETPPAELLRCPAVPLGLPSTGEALIPADWRSAITRLSRSRGEVAGQLARLIAWHTGRECGAD